MRWLAMTGALLVWAAHFTGVYLLSSVADVVASPEAPAWRLAGLAFSLACLAAAAGVVFWCWRRRRTSPDRPVRWEADVAVAAGLISIAGIFWQSLPLAF